MEIQGDWHGFGMHSRFSASSHGWKYIWGTQTETKGSVSLTMASTQLLLLVRRGTVHVSGESSDISHMCG